MAKPKGAEILYREVDGSAKLIFHKNSDMNDFIGKMRSNEPQRVDELGLDGLIVITSGKVGTTATGHFEVSIVWRKYYGKNEQIFNS